MIAEEPCQGMVIGDYFGTEQKKKHLLPRWGLDHISKSRRLIIFQDSYVLSSLNNIPRNLHLNMTSDLSDPSDLIRECGSGS